MPDLSWKFACIWIYCIDFSVLYQIRDTEWKLNYDRVSAPAGRFESLEQVIRYSSNSWTLSNIDTVCLFFFFTMLIQQNSISSTMVLKKGHAIVKEWKINMHTLYAENLCEVSSKVTLCEKIYKVQWMVPFLMHISCCWIRCYCLILIRTNA